MAKKNKNKQTETVSLSRAVQIFKVFGPFLKPYWRRIVVAYAAMAAAVGLTVLTPWPLKFIFDYVLIGEQMPEQLGKFMVHFGHLFADQNVVE